MAVPCSLSCLDLGTSIQPDRALEGILTHRSSNELSIHAYSQPPQKWGIYREKRSVCTLLSVSGN